MPVKKLCLCIFWGWFIFSHVSAQLIEIKTIPIASDNQFRFQPSFRSGMANVSITLDDPMLDLFMNPAHGLNLSGYHFYISPTIYGSDEETYGARTLPLTFTGKSGNWFGAISAAVQDMKFDKQTFFPPNEPFIDAIPVPAPRMLQNDVKNHFLHGSLGYVLTEGITAIGLAATYADLNGVSGVDMLYSQSDAVEQSGSITGFRAGVIHSFATERFIETILLFEKSKIRHDVFYTDWIFNEEMGYSLPYQRIEKNLDYTDIWGIHVGYQQPLAGTDWHIGGIITINRKDHPKIPNYELMNIPRDPGNSWAYNIGLGLSRSQNGADFGLELIYEPIWSHTWALAAEPVEKQFGGIIPVGDRTVDNTFDFSNYILRVGISRLHIPVGFQMGLEFHTYNYRLKQLDYIRSTGRIQNEDWTEWTLTWGLIIDAEDFQICYYGRRQSGVGIPGVNTGSWRTDAANAVRDFLVAPSGELTLSEQPVTTHQIILSIPLTD